MNNRDYREIQISSTLLIFVFLGILIIGVVIFLLGVSVGKKQAQIIAESEIPAKKEVTQVKEKEPVVPPEPKDLISQELASHQKIEEEAQKQKTLPQDLYYIQIGAFNNEKAALTVADQFKKEGYPALVLDPLSSDKKPVYRVRIGGFSSQEEAEKTKAKLESEQKRKDLFIIKEEELKL